MYMEFTERVNAKNARWLLASLSDDFLKQNILEGEEERFNFSYVKKTLQLYCKDGTRKAVYRKKDKFGILRDYAQGIQTFPTLFRGLLCKNMTDVDMVNCHPVVIWNLCLKHQISCHYLEEYVKNRKSILEKGYCSKLDIIRSINKKQPLKCDGWLKSFDQEMKLIQKQFYKMPEYEKQRILSETNPRNREGSFMSHLATTYEAIILHAVLPTNLEIGVLMYDGFMFYGERPAGLLEDLSRKAKEIGFEIQFSYKEHDNTLTVPEDWKEQDDDLYLTLKQKYEKDYCLAYIEKDVMYSYKVGGKIYFYNQGDCSQHFNHVLVGKQSFFSLWNKDASKQTYQTVGSFPHDVECPDGVLNLWTGYAAEKLPESDSDISLILNHIHTLLGSDAEFILDWFANMFQFPSSRSLLVVIQGEEGCGKSIIMDFITAMMGSTLSIEIQDVKEDLFGRFNGILAGKVFLNINETSRHEMMPFIEKLKSIITSPTINIEEKGQKKYIEQNLSHLMMTINPENVLAIKEGSRRFFYSRANNELIGNTEYFNELGDFIERPKNQRAFYQFLMSRPVKRKITIKDIPESAVMQEMYELNKDPVEDYLAEFEGERTSQENYNAYKSFLMNNGLKFELSKKAFETKVGKFRKKYGIEKNQVMEKGVRFYVYKKVAPQLEADLLPLLRDAE